MIDFEVVPRLKCSLKIVKVNLFCQELLTLGLPQLLSYKSKSHLTLVL